MNTKSMQKVPREIWAQIFRLVLDQELNDYTKRLQFFPFRSVPMVLAAVCGFWRGVVHTESQIWNVVNITPSNYLSGGTVEILHNHIRRSRGTLTFVTSFCEAVPRNRINNLSPDQNSKLSWVMNNVIEERSYFVHLVIKKGSQLYRKKAKALPFREPKMLKINILSAGLFDGLEGIYSTFSTVDNLDLTYLGNQPNQLRRLTVNFPSLRVLSLHLRDIGEFEFTAMSNSDLEELYVHYNGSGAAKDLYFRLPKLKILGTTHPSYSLLENLDAPHLHEVHLYGSHYHSPNVGYRPNAIQLIESTRRLVMKDWFRANEPLWASPKDAGSIFASVVTKMPKLQSASFVNCHVDGSAIVRLLKGHSANNDSAVPHLETLEFAGCNGITRAECEELKGLVSTIVIYS
ncbi:hypothetical protein CPB86DRAFT_872790 [Serendipita vermifera]|nr:hypothetical protein CPB86DRAFT_872790 [Serendipita vermifera]